jgi:hypothetical protein
LERVSKELASPCPAAAAAHDPHPAIELAMRSRKAAKLTGINSPLLGHVAEVKAQAEDTILIANARIGEEIKKVPKALGGDQKSKWTKVKLVP